MPSSARRPSTSAVARAALLTLELALLASASCGRDSSATPPNEVDDRAAARELSAGDHLRAWRSAAARPVVLYVDLSQSMRGFLDAEFDTDSLRYRAVIEMLDARLRPTPVYGFGSTVRVAGERALSTLENRAIYSDGNTQMEDVFPRIAADSQLDSSHLVIGDGRRSDPIRAIDQYVRMRHVAAEWIARGGTFAVAASQAPFTKVSADPSGCRTNDGGGGARCPLYAFAFIAPGDEARVASALAERFEHLFVTPAPAADERAVALRVVTPSPEVGLNPVWVERQSGGFVARVRADTFTNQPLEAELVPADTDSPLGRVRAAVLAGEAVRAELHARRLHGGPTEAWQPVGGPNQLVIPGASPVRWRFVSRGENAERVAYRIDLVPAGVPTWLRDFDATAAGDPLRTYGLGRLFQGFRGNAGPPVLRAFVVVN